MAVSHVSVVVICAGAGAGADVVCCVQVIPAAHRNEDGFWLKVDESKAPTLPKGMYNARYGTMEDDTPGSPRLSRQWRVWAAGAAVMLILVGWVLYMHVDSLGWH